MQKTKAKHGNQSYETIRRTWGDVEVVDAEKDLRVFIQPEDVATASRKDPGCCVFAQACKRQFSASKVLFWKSVAYVELPGPSGKRRVERFSMSPQMRDLVENFDRGNVVENVAGFELKAPRPSYTLAGKASKQKRFIEKRRKALINGAASVTQGKGAYEKPAIIVDLSVRRGTGLVHFSKKVKNGR
jgi:hypothetical protein